MPRIPDDELDRIKNEIDLAALVRSKGIELNKHGAKDLVGLSPFSKEKTASFIVTPSKNLWHCMSSGKGGSVIDFIIEYEGVSFRHAVELLRTGSASKLMNGSKPSKKSTVPKLEAPVSFDADDQTLFKQVLDYYHERLLQTPSALDYLKKRGINADVIYQFKLGYADRTLGLRLPHKNRVDGQEIRTRLQKIGLYRESGHEHFNGCIVFPITDTNSNVTEIYGRRANNKQKSKIYHLYLPGPHRGVFNVPGLALSGGKVILTESVIDALTFWVNNHVNVTCIYGTEGFTDDHEQAFKKYNIKTVYLAYDRDKAGDRAAERDASRLSSIGIDCYRVQFPHGQDVNEYATKVTPAGKSLKVLLNAAQPMLGKRQESSDHSYSSTKILAANKLAAKEKKADQGEQTEPDSVLCVNSVVKNNPAPKQSGEDYIIEIGERNYRIRGLQKNTSFEVLKINLRVMVNENYYLDTLDLYRAKDRQHFINLAASETNLKPELIKRDIGKVLLQLEQLQEKRINAELEPSLPEVEISDDDRKEALEFLKDRKLIERLLVDFDRCGVAGESNNKVTGWLAGVSRKLRKPLAVIVQSSSAAGKSTLMEAILNFFPEEEQVKYSAMTGQSLYYLGETNLKHKILAIVEEEGAEKASYALKLLQSEGELTIASTGKDPDTGRMRTEEYHVEGPVMIFLTTTAIDIDEELLNRCLVLTVDEGEVQTGLIHERQRMSRTFDGMVASEQREAVLKLQKNVQRLLKPYRIVNEYARSLTFASHRTRARRDHEKYLTLIDAVTLVHQHQRKVEQHQINGKTIEFIRTTIEDIRIANELAPELLGRSFDDLPVQTRKLLNNLREMVDQLCKEKDVDRCDCPFNRRQVREFTNWGNTQIKVHLDRLEELEYIERHRGSFGQAYLYELVYDGTNENRAELIGLIDTEKLREKYLYDRNLAEPEGDLSGAEEELAGDFRDEKVN